jgi:hypothetical protein
MARGALRRRRDRRGTFVTASRDFSENRMNSFPKPDEEALERIREPLRIEAHLAAEDPRRVDLERLALSKLRRVMPRVQVSTSPTHRPGCSSRPASTTARSGTSSADAAR